MNTRTITDRKRIATESKKSLIRHLGSFFAAILMLASQQTNAASGITYSGRILDSNNEPVTSSDVRFTVTIYDSLGQCWLYTEQRQLDLSSSNGTFSFDIGSNDSTLIPATASFNGSVTGPQNMSDVFNNIKTFSGLGTANSCSGTYTPNPSDLTAGRVLAIYFSVSSGPAQALPVLKINPVPSALTVGGYGSGELLRIGPAVSTGANPNTALVQSQYDEFWRLVKNPLAAYLPTSGDVTVVSGNNKVTSLLGQALPASAPTNGQVLVSNGTAWTLQAMSAGSVASVGVTAPITNSGTASAPVIAIPAATTSADGYLSSTDWNTFNSKMGNTLSDGTIFIGNGSNVATERTLSGDATLSNTGALTLATTVTAGSVGGASAVPQITYDAKGRITAATSVTVNDTSKLPLAGGTMSGAIAMGTNDITGVGNITMGANKYFTLSANSTDGTTTGQMWLDGATIKYYDGSSVRSLGVAGAGITSLNGLSGGTQTFAANNSGTAIGWTSSGTSHTLSVPLASAGASTNGVISNTDYLRIGKAESLNGKAFDTTAASTMGQMVYFDSAADKWKVSAATAPADGQVMKWNDTTKVWEPGADAGGWSAVDASYAAKGIVQFNTDAATSGVTVASGVATVLRTATGTSSQILALDGSGVANMYGAGLKGATSGTLTLQAAATSANYSIKFPAATPEANQSLQSDASGNLSWVNNLSAVSGSANLANTKIWVGDASGKAAEQSLGGDATLAANGTLSLASTTTAATKGTASLVPQITYDAKGRITSVTEVTVDDTAKLPLAGGTMSGDIAMGTNDITGVGDITMGANKYFTLSANTTNGTSAGQMWYDTGTIKYFDGSTVKSLGVAGSGITSLNGLTGNTQTFASVDTGTSVTAPGWSSSGTAHTLKIPMASDTGVTAGLLSKTDYDKIGTVADGYVTSTKILDGTIVNADINASAAIDASKIGGGAVSTTEFGYLDGVTSSIQTQLDSKLASPLTTKGDVMIHNGTTTTRLPAGTNGYVLKANSAVTEGVEWAAAGTVTSIATNNGLTGGTITGTGTIGLATIATNTVLANITAGTAVPTATTVPTLLSAIGNTQGNILYRDGTGWTVLAPGTAGYVLQTGGAGANPSWVASPASTAITALTGDVTATGPGSVAASIGTGKVTSTHILDATVAKADLNFTGSAATANVVTVDSGGKFTETGCSSAGNVLTWTVAGWVCSAPSISGAALATGKIWVGDSNVASEVTMSGDITMSSTGVTSYNGTVPVNKGGTGSTTLTDEAILVGNGTSAVTFLTPTLGNVIYGSGSAWSKGTPDTAGLVAKSGNQTAIAGTKEFTGAITMTSTLNVTGAISGSGNISTSKQIYGGAVTSNATASVNFDNGNVQTTSYDCAGTIALTNLVSGGSYTLVVTGTGTAKCSFTADGTAISDARFAPTNTTRSANSHTVYTFVKVGTQVYASWIAGFGQTQ